MCGIAGIVDRNRTGEREALLDLVRRMADALAHRGPDDSGAWASLDSVAFLSHRRLSIIDLSPAGRGPMHSADGRLTISFNGEIYNFLELREELKTAGYRFKSNTDTEVILASYDRWGIECLQHLVGMFAFGLWDSAARRLFLARDRLGKKPLYYTERAGRFAFASELKALLADPEFPRELDPDALSLYLLYGYVPSPYSIFRAARKLPPAHYAELDDTGLSVRRYWDPIAVALSGQEWLSDGEAKERFVALARNAVRQRLMSDVPLGVFLSGGLDSSLVTALMREVSSAPVKTFTIRFENPEYNEADQAAAVAGHLGTEHYQATCGLAQLLDLVDDLPEMLDEPFADSSALPTYLVSKITRAHVTVALAGDGGDELFYGYPRYEALARYRWLLRSPRVVRRTAGALVGALPRRRFRRAGELLRLDGGDVYGRFITWWTADEVGRMTGRAPVANPLYRETESRLAGLPLAERPPLLDLVTYLPEDILTKVDRASMAVSLEARAPLLDHRVVEFALQLPLRMKWRGRTSKWLLRQVLYDRVPRRLVERPKMGFGVPLSDWFRGPLRDRMDATVAGSSAADIGISPTAVRRIWADFLSGRSHRTDVIWSYFALMSWAGRWMRR